jgi:hypothetical protein
MYCSEASIKRSLRITEICIQRNIFFSLIKRNLLKTESFRSLRFRYRHVSRYKFQYYTSTYTSVSRSSLLIMYWLL